VSTQQTQKIGLWGLSSPRLAALLAVLFVILLIQAFPQVDLLDTAFQSKTAPLEIHAYSTSSPGVMSFVAIYISTVMVGQSFFIGQQSILARSDLALIPVHGPFRL